MDTITHDKVCICSTNHSIPLSHKEIFTALDELYDAELLELTSSFEHVQSLGDFTYFHVDSELWARWVDGAMNDMCLYDERHRKADCLDDYGGE